MSTYDELTSKQSYQQQQKIHATTKIKMSDVVEPFLYNLGEEVPRDVIFVIVHHSFKILPPRVFMTVLS